MKAVIQRVKRAKVEIEDGIVSSINKGLCVLLGVHREDTQDDAKFIAEKISNLRIFSDSSGKFNLSVKDVQGEILLVSQFTLLGNCSRGRRPDFLEAAPPEQAKRIFDLVSSFIEKEGIKVSTGVFQAYMLVSIENDGPVTIILDSREKKR